VHAPDAVEVFVNGVSRHFVRDEEGNVYPALEEGTVTVSYRQEITTSPVPADKWMAIGPFSIVEGDVKASLMKPLPPEEELKFDAVYEGGKEEKIRWVPGDSEEGLKLEGRPKPEAQWAFPKNARSSGVNFLHTHGVARNGICYAVTFINSPDERDAKLTIACDYWSRAWLNGKEVISERPQGMTELDGAQFKADNMLFANVHLNKGVNVLLVKLHGGNGSTSFTAGISNAEGLTFTRNRK
jgi:hypothetical protein